MTISFERLQESHFPQLLRWLEKPHVKKWWDQDVAYTIDLVREKYSSYIKGYKLEGENQKSIHAFIIYNNQRAVGYIQIYNAYDFPRRKPLSDLPAKLGAIDIFIGEKDLLGRGLGSVAISDFLKLDETRQYCHIFVDPDSKNIAAIKCYEKVGFKRVALHKDSGEVWMILNLREFACRLNPC